MLVNAIKHIISPDASEAPTLSAAQVEAASSSPETEMDHPTPIRTPIDEKMV